jgi:hypothetical protein
MLARVAVIAVAVMLSAGCGSKQSASTNTSGKEAGTRTPLASARCVVPGFKIMDKIASTVGKGATGIGPAMAVRSRDFTPTAYFISAALKPNRLFHGRIATWIAPAINSDVGFLWSADAATKENTGMGFMPPAGGGPAAATDDGGPESVACARQMFKLQPRSIWPKP